jgi:tetratricopeptide (TPR) repeat protein
LLAERGVLVVHIKDLRDYPVAGVRLRAGAGSSVGSSREMADSFGTARIKLAAQTKPGDVVMLEIVAAPKDKDLVIISPWDKWAHVPPFDDEAKNFIPVVLVARGDRACLESPPCLRAAAARINQANAPRMAREPDRDERAKEALATVAQIFGLKPEEINLAIRAWREKTEDPYDKGLAALYEKDYPQASQDLQISLEKRMRAEAKAQSDVAAAALFLGRSLYEQGKYRQAAEALQVAAIRRPDDSQILNNLGLSLASAGDYVRAETVYRHALRLDVEIGGRDNPRSAPVLHNLAELLQDKGESAQAETLYRQALAIDEQALGPNDSRVAATLSDLATLLQERGDYSGAEKLYLRALRIHESNLGPDDPHVGTDLANLALLWKVKGDFARAEPLYRRALAIQENAQGPDHPHVASALNNLASLLQDKGDLVAAEPLYRRALAIEEKQLGPGHPDVATVLNNLAMLLSAKGDYAGAEPLARRALAILERKFGPNDPRTKQARDNLELVLNRK